jgi:hypothetical protein
LHRAYHAGQLAFARAVSFDDNRRTVEAYDLARDPEER